MYTNKLLTSDVVASKQYALHSAIDYLEKNMEKLDTNAELYVAKISEVFHYLGYIGDITIDYHLGQVFTEDGGNAIVAGEDAYAMLINSEADANMLVNWYKKFNGKDQKVVVTIVDKEAHRKIIFDEHAKLLVELNKLNEFLEALASQGY